MNKVFNVQAKDAKITLKGPMSETPNNLGWGILYFFRNFFRISGLGGFLCPVRARRNRNPKGPKIEKIQDRPPGLKFSIEIEIFKRATQQTPIFVGNSEGQD